MVSVKVQRTGEMKEPPDRVRYSACWISAIFIVVALHFILVLFQIGDSPPTKLGSLSILATGLTAVGLLSAYLWANFLLRLNFWRSHFDEFGEGVLHCAPTQNGWVACGRDWIGISYPPHTQQRMSVNDISNFAWGMPNGSHEKFEKDIYFGVPKLLANASGQRYWIYVHSEQNPAQDFVMHFRHRRQMLEWTEVIQDIKAGRTIKVPKQKSQPTLRELALRSGLLHLVRAVYCIVLISTYEIIELYFPGARMVLVFVKLGILSLYLFGSQNTPFDLYREIQYSLAGGDPEMLSTKALPIAERSFFLPLQSLADGKGFERLPLESIQDARLEVQQKDNVFTRDISRMFVKNDKPTSKVLIISLTDATDLGREITLPSEVADQWYGELRSLLSQKSPV